MSTPSPTWLTSTLLPCISTTPVAAPSPGHRSPSRRLQDTDRHRAVSRTCHAKFAKHFQKYGVIKDSVIMMDHTRMPRGFGFVTFSDPSMIDRVPEDEHTIDGRTVRPLLLTAR